MNCLWSVNSYLCCVFNCHFQFTDLLLLGEKSPHHYNKMCPRFFPLFQEFLLINTLFSQFTRCIYNIFLKCLFWALPFISIDLYGMRRKLFKCLWSCMKKESLVKREQEFISHVEKAVLRSVRKSLLQHINCRGQVCTILFRGGLMALTRGLAENLFS